MEALRTEDGAVTAEAGADGAVTAEAATVPAALAVGEEGVPDKPDEILVVKDKGRVEQLLNPALIFIDAKLCDKNLATERKTGCGKCSGSRLSLSLLPRRLYI
jgi:hypothetical protein